jgi:hypothetical protein
MLFSINLENRENVSAIAKGYDDIMYYFRQRYYAATGDVMKY